MAVSPIRTYSANNRLYPLYDPDDADEYPINLAPNLSLTRGTILGELSATPGTFKPYASANTDGSQVPKLILGYSCQTDASGNVTLSSTAGTTGDEHGFTEPYTTAYSAGTFATEDLTGFDANALAVMNGKLIYGTVAGPGVVSFPG